MTSVACIVALAGVAKLQLRAARVPKSCESSYMHRDHWIPADDPTKVFRLFACSLTPQVSHLTPAPGCLVLARRAALLCRCAKPTGVRPPNTLKSPQDDTRTAGEQPIDWQNCATGALDRSHLAIRSAQIWVVFGDAKRDIGSDSSSELG
jgi:hypothetical protein